MLKRLRKAIKTRWIRRKLRNNRIRGIEKVGSRIQSRLEDAHDPSRELDAEGRKYLLAAYKKNEPDQALLASLIQDHMWRELYDAGIEIPKQYLVDDPLMGPVVNIDGVTWARATLRKHRRENIEFWAKIVMPSLSLIVSIIALYVATHKK